MSYRVGRKLGTTIYYDFDQSLTKQPLAWVPDNPDLARRIVELLNEDILRASKEPAGPGGLELAKMVVSYFGDDEIEDVLDGDIRLREAARALIAKAKGRK